MTPPHHLSVERSARYYTRGPSDARRLWFVLHGYGQLAADFLQAFAPIDDGTRLLVAPEALSRFYVEDGDGPVGASWMTRADREHELSDRSRPSEICLLGFSQGAATACRWSARGSLRPDRLVLWAGDLPPDVDLDRLRGIDLTLVAGSRDPYVTPERLAEAKARLNASRLASGVYFLRLHADDAAETQQMVLAR